MYYNSNDSIRGKHGSGLADAALAPLLTTKRRRLGTLPCLPNPTRDAGGGLETAGMGASGGTHAPGGDPFSRQPKQVNTSSFLAGGRAFVLPTETVCSRNITPAPGTHMPAGLSRADFLYVMYTGCDPQDANFRDPQACELLQVMPWPNFRK